MLGPEFQRQPRARRGVAQVDRGVLFVLGFQDVKDGILKFGSGNQHPRRNRGLQFERRLDFHCCEKVAVDRGCSVESVSQFRRVRGPEDSSLAQGNLLPG